MRQLTKEELAFLRRLITVHGPVTTGKARYEIAVKIGHNGLMQGGHFNEQLVRSGCILEHVTRKPWEAVLTSVPEEPL